METLALKQSVVFLASLKIELLNSSPLRASEIAELRPARRQARLPHSRSLLLPGREIKATLSFTMTGVQ